MEVEDFPRGRALDEGRPSEGAKRDGAKRRRGVDGGVAKGFAVPTVAAKVDVCTSQIRIAGAKAMGMVTEVGEKQLRVHLPHAGEEFVDAAEASDVLSVLLRETDDAEAKLLRKLHDTVPTLTELFAPGQYVRGTYVQRSENDDVTFSLKLSDLYDKAPLGKLPQGALLTACVRSIEDHGYTLTFGQKGVSGFLKRTELDPFYGDGTTLLPGQLIDCTLCAVTSQGILQATVNPEALQKSIVTEGSTLKAEAILPGCLVYAEITRILPTGLCLRVRKHQRGSISLFHLPQEEVKEGWPADFAEGQMVKARVLSWIPLRSEYVLSLKPFLVGLGLPPMPAVIGQVFTEARVQRADVTGLALRLPTEGSPTPCYVFRQSLSDLPLEPTDFRLRQLVSARVTGFHAMEGLLIGSLKESVIRSGIVCFDDLYPGRVAEGSIVRICDDRVYVSIGEGMEGCARQCGYSPSVSLRRIFNPGQIVSYRVLKVKSEIRLAILSLDAQLVHASLPFLTSWDDAEVGMRVIGYVLAIKKSVVIVAFAGDVHGVLPQDGVQLASGEALSDCFHKNQVIKPWIRTVYRRRQRILLTTIKQQLQETLPPKQKVPHFTEQCRAPIGLEVGETADATVEQILKDTGYLVSYSVHESHLQGKAFLPAGHLSDHPLPDQHLRQALKKGQSIGEVVVLNVTDFVRVSRKRSLVRDAVLLPRKLEDVKENALLPGYVSFVGEDFLKVAFLGTVTGRVFKNQMPLQGISPKRQFCVDQTVRVRVVRVDVERGRLNLTLNPSRTPATDAVFLEDAFADLALCRPLSRFKGELSRKQIGEAVNITVRSITENGVQCEVESGSGVLGLVPKEHFDEDPPDVTSQSCCRACLLDVGLEGSAVLSLKPYLLERGFKTVKKASKKRKKELEEQKSTAAVVEWITEHYAAVSLPEADHSIAIMSLSDYNFSSFPLFKGVQLRQQISVHKQTKRTLTGCPIVSMQLPSLLWQRDVRKEMATMQMDGGKEVTLHEGDAVSGTVGRTKEDGVVVELSTEVSSHTHATVPFIDVFDHFTDQLPTVLHSGLPVKGTVRKISEKGVILSLRPSEGGSFGAEIAFLDQQCPVHLGKSAIETGDRLYGYVSGYGKSKDFLFVNVARDVYATVYPPHLGDAPVAELPQQFPLGSLVRGYVVSCKYPKIGLSLRSGKMPLETAGAVKKGTIASVMPQGVYVALEGNGFQGLVPRYDLRPHETKGLKAGQRVTVKISPLTDAFHLMLNFAEEQREQDVMDVEEAEERGEETVNEVPQIDDSNFESVLAAAVEAESAVRSENQGPGFVSQPAQTPYSLEQKQQMWGDVAEDVTPPAALTASQDVPTRPEVKPEPVRDPDDAPNTDNDFERLLFSHPNSSYLWIRYMAFHVEHGDLARARATAERALESVSFREEKTRLDIWLAYLNLERSQGSATEQILSLFQRAVLSNDPKKLHLAFLKILEGAQSTEIGDQVLKSMQRRCPSSAKVYIQELHYWLATNRGSRCKRTLDMALKNLPKRKHLKVMLQASILEFKIGKVERGRDLFEGLLALYPKRMDLWNVYLDQELAQHDPEHVRALFERVTSIDGGRKNMKWIFKRFLNFEMQHGTPNSIEHVKEKARAYVAQKSDS